MWIEITEAHLLTRISGAELEAFRAAVLGDGQVDPVDDTIAQCVSLARGYIAGCDNNTLGTDNTIPDKLLGPVLALIVMEVESRCAGRVIDPNGHRARSAENAMAILRDVAACRVAIEAPEEETDEVIGSVSPSISNDREIQFSRANQDGA